jgi:hypothetical protein
MPNILKKDDLMISHPIPAKERFKSRLHFGASPNLVLNLLWYPQLDITCFDGQKKKMNVFYLKNREYILKGGEEQLEKTISWTDERDRKEREHEENIYKRKTEDKR